MVIYCNTTEYSKEKEKQYETYFKYFSYPLSTFQKNSIESILCGNHTLVTAHTSNGKTTPAEFAIQYFNTFEKKKKIIYTCPIKSLSNQKYWDFTTKYPHISFGIMTGDIKFNPTADVVIMTAEILLNSLHTSSSSLQTQKQIQDIDIYNDVACVIMDEVHFILDEYRGFVWEQTIMLLPNHIQLLMLSATMDNPVCFAEWIEQCKTGSNKDVVIASTNVRIVPLKHYAFMTTTSSIFKKVKDKQIQQQIKESTNKLISLKNDKDMFNEEGYYSIKKMVDLHAKNDMHLKPQHVLNNLTHFLVKNELLPAIIYVFSRKNVEKYADCITTNLLEDDSKIPYIIRKEVEQIIRSKLSNGNEYLQLPKYESFIRLLERGIGIHHAGMTPIFREIVELMIIKNYLKIIVSTETIAIGINAPIKTTVYTSLKKYDGKTDRFLMSHEYTQGAGRAGRRGIDSVGYVIHCSNLFRLPSLTDYKRILCGNPKSLISQLHLDYTILFALLKNSPTGTITIKDAIEFIEKSLYFKEIIKEKNALQNEIDILNKRTCNDVSIQTDEKIIEKYEFLKKTEFLSKKKQKQNIIELNELIKENPSLKNDVVMRENKQKIYDELMYLNSFICSSLTNIIYVLENKGYIIKENIANNTYIFTIKGQIASTIFETNGLVIAEFLQQTGFLKDMTVVEIIQLFSLFTDVRVPEDRRILSNQIERKDLILLTTIYNEFHELKGCMNQSDKEKELVFDILEEIAEWATECNDEGRCRIFLEKIMETKEISTGEIIKAILKISLISKELIHVCELTDENEDEKIMLEKMELKTKLLLIDGMILKHICLNQSLYI